MGAPFIAFLLFAMSGHLLRASKRPVSDKISLMRYFQSLRGSLWVSLFAVVATAVACAQTTGVPTQASTITAPAASLTAEQVREYLRLTQFGEIWRAGWIRAMDASEAKGAPYWPESFWTDLKQHMATVDLVPMVTELYQNHVSFEDMQHANEDLRKMNIADFAATPFGAHFCQETQLSGPDNEAATLTLTQTVFEQVYEAHKADIKSARAKYLATHPGYVDPK